MFASLTDPFSFRGGPRRATPTPGRTTPHHQWPDPFRRSVSQVETEREDILRTVASLESRREIPRQLLTRDNIERFATGARPRLHGDDPSLRKAYVKQFIDRIEVDDEEIRIIGPTANLAAAMLRSGHPNTPEVRSFVNDWWAHKDSNLGPAD